MMPDLEILYDVVEATWPPARASEHGPFTIRDGAGGGKRVSAATANAPVTADMLPIAEAAMAELGQSPLFMIREGEDALDTVLASQGYGVIDPVNIYTCAIETLLSAPLPRVTTFVIWEPLAVMRDIWAEGGIGPGRIAVMVRASVPKTAIFGRHDDHPAATAYVAIHDGIAMVHALEVLPQHRRAGHGKHMMRQAAHWAAQHGATHMSVICTQANQGANALYPSLGMSVVGTYHYRQKESYTA